MTYGIEPTMSDGTSREEWYNGGFRGRAPPIEHGKGKGYRVADLWCSVFYTRFIGSKKECEKWLREHRKKDCLPKEAHVEKWDGNEDTRKISTIPLFSVG